MSLFKNFPIGERFSINLRAEAFNVFFNIQNYGVPDTNVLQQDPNAGVITSTVSDSPREIQFGVHLNF